MQEHPLVQRDTARAAFPRFVSLSTRWMDNDTYGHVNNVVYYSYFDTAVNHYLIAQGALQLGQSEVIGLVVETQCRYFRPVAFPDTIHVGVRVAHIGSSSVRYELGIFATMKIKRPPRDILFMSTWIVSATDRCHCHRYTGRR